MQNFEKNNRYDGALQSEPVRATSWDEYREQWNLAETRSILTRHPLHLDMELTSKCNLRCHMCWQNGLLNTEAQGLMSYELFKTVINDGVKNGLQAIKLQSRGESTLHPHIAKFIKYAKDAGIKDVQLTTNGMVFWDKPKRLVDIIAAGIDKLIFSIDDAHDQSALEIYGEARMPDVRKIVQTAMDMRRDIGPKALKIRIQTNFVFPQTNEGMIANLREQFPDADEYTAVEMWEADFNREGYPELRSRFELLPCPYLWTRLVVFWDGEVALCCRDYNNVHRLGNVKTQSVQDIWLGEKMMKLRRSHLAGERQQVSVCRNCELYVQPNELS